MLIFFFKDTATTDIYTLSLHDALPIYRAAAVGRAGRRRVLLGDRHRHDEPRVRHACGRAAHPAVEAGHARRAADRKSTRLNSSHANISYAVFCLKKKKRRTSVFLLSST